MTDNEINLQRKIKILSKKKKKKSIYNCLQIIFIDDYMNI